MSKYQDTIKEVKETSQSTGYSKPVDVKLAKALLEDRDFEKRRYVKSGDSFEKKVSKPVDEFWSAVEKSAVKNLGVDAADAANISRNVSKDMAAAFSDLANSHVMGYLATGKNYVFDPVDDKSTKAVLSLREMPEKTVETVKNEKQEDGSYKRVPTGNTVKYTKRTEMVCSNKHLPTTKFKIK